MTYITYIYRRRDVGTGMVGRVNRRNPQIEMPTAKNSVNFRTRPNCTKIGIQTNSTPAVIFYLRRNEKFGLLHVQTGIETLSERISPSICGIRTWLLVGLNRLVITQNFSSLFWSESVRAWYCEMSNMVLFCPILPIYGPIYDRLYIGPEGDH